MQSEERRLLESLSALARCNPFLPERIERERDALGAAFEPRNAVWSKSLDRDNPNVAKLVAIAEPVAQTLRKRFDEEERASFEDKRLYEELVYYLLYYRFEEDFERAMRTAEVAFYDDFVERARFYLEPVGTLDSRETAHWFAFLFQVRRASHHIFDFIVGSSLPAARLRGAVWQSIFTHDLRRYRRGLYDRMGDLATLITGPSGTGKELVAQAIGLSRYIPFHPSRGRFELESTRAFYPLNLSALAPTLIESELFGHRRGAFTGALSDRKGFFALCPSLGTVFLDEIGELDPQIQVKLLRVLQTREFQPLGDAKPQSFHGKIIAATNRDLASEMRAGRFRDDLYYRLCSDLIETPSLKAQLEDTPDDIENLVRFIARRVVPEGEADALTAEVLGFIASRLGDGYAWPGNVRELEQCVRNVMVRCEYRPPALGRKDSQTSPSSVVDLETAAFSADELLEAYCASVYERTGSFLEASRVLRLDRRTVKSKVEAFERRRKK